MATEGHDLSAFVPNELPKLKGGTIGIVVSEWNDEITSNLLKGVQTVLDASIAKEGITSYFVNHVPGSFELPLGAQFLFEAGEVDAVICIGSVIRGETAHFDFVCQPYISRNVSNIIKDVSDEFN